MRFLVLAACSLLLVTTGLADSYDPLTLPTPSEPVNVRDLAIQDAVEREEHASEAALSELFAKGVAVTTAF